MADIIERDGLICFYCKKPVEIITIKRDPIQLTLERRDNTKGHTRGNCVISCLGCNTHRGDRFRFSDYRDASFKRNKGDYSNMNKLISEHYEQRCHPIDSDHR